MAASLLSQLIERRSEIPGYVVARLIRPYFALRNYLGRSNLFVALFRRRVVRSFNKLYYLLRKNTLDSTLFMGKHVLKMPTDLWSYQEIIFERKPDVIVETGVFLGGSTFFYSKLLELMGHGRVISIDITLDHADPELNELDNVTLIEGDTGAGATLEKVRALIGKDESVMVVLDSDHAASHVYKEMKLFSSLVTEGQYLIVEDGLIESAYPVFWRSGPVVAIKKFLKDEPGFSIDPYRNRFLLSQNPSGYLLRGSAAQPARLRFEREEECLRPLRLWLPHAPPPADMEWLEKLDQNVKR